MGSYCSRDGTADGPAGRSATVAPETKPDGAKTSTRDGFDGNSQSNASPPTSAYNLQAARKTATTAGEDTPLANNEKYTRCASGSEAATPNPLASPSSSPNVSAHHLGRNSTGSIAGAAPTTITNLMSAPTGGSMLQNNSFGLCDRSDSNTPSVGVTESSQTRGEQPAARFTVDDAPRHAGQVRGPSDGRPQTRDVDPNLITERTSVSAGSSDDEDEPVDLRRGQAVTKVVDASREPAATPAIPSTSLPEKAGSAPSAALLQQRSTSSREEPACGITADGDEPDEDPQVVDGSSSSGEYEMPEEQPQEQVPAAGPSGAHVGHVSGGGVSRPMALDISGNDLRGLDEGRYQKISTVTQITDDIRRKIAMQRTAQAMGSTQEQGMNGGDSGDSDGSFDASSSSSSASSSSESDDSDDEDGRPSAANIALRRLRLKQAQEKKEKKKNKKKKKDQKRKNNVVASSAATTSSTTAKYAGTGVVVGNVDVSHYGNGLTSAPPRYGGAVAPAYDDDDDDYAFFESGPSEQMAAVSFGMR